MSTVIRPRPASTDRHRATDFGDIDALAGRIATALGVTHEEARRTLVEEYRNCGTSVRREMARLGIRPHMWSDALIQFYESTDAFFYELCAWNATAEKKSQRAWIIDHLRRRQRPLSILTYGDGLGFDGVELSLAGHNVTCYEVSRRCRSFAERLARDHRVGINWLDCERDLLGRRFDAIVCLDVLEHVPDPPRLVRQLSELLLPDGELIVHAPFWLLDKGTTTHLASNRTYSGDTARLYAPAGLVPVDCRWMWNPLVLVRRDVRALRMPARVRLSRMILQLARWVPLPFRLIARRLINIDLRRRLKAESTAATGTNRSSP